MIMKILYIIHQFYPEYRTGTEKFILNISTMMQKSGNKVKVLTYSFYNDSFYDKSTGNILSKEFSYNGIPVIAFKHKKIPKDINYALENKDMANIAESIIAKEKPDIIHVGHSLRMSEFLRVSKRLGIPYIITLTDFFLICPQIVLSTSKGNLCAGPEKGIVCANLCSEFPVTTISERLEAANEILFNAKLIIVPSRFVASIYKNQLRDIDINIINHGMNYDTIKKNKKRYKKGEKLIFCYAGTLAQHKGIHILLDAFKAIKANNITLKIYGSGLDNNYINMLKDMTKEDKRIEFCGVFSENQVGDIFSKVDIVIVPSLCFETYSFVIHEALACNVPVISSNVGGMAERIKDGINGYTFKIGDSKHLKEILETIINNPEMINLLKEGIRNYMIPSIEQEAYLYEREYRNILNK